MKAAKKEWTKNYEANPDVKEARRARRSSPEVKESAKYYAIRKNYGLTREEYDELISIYNSSCGACGSTVSICVDHDHDTGIVRGMLCRKCNAALGLLGDKIDGVLNLLEYLDR
jgi:hypothetical protein